MQSNGLLITTRTTLTGMLRKHQLSPDPRRVPVLGLSHDEVARRYRGFDGEPWGGRDWETLYPFLPESGLASISQFTQVRDVLRRDFGQDSDLIYVGGAEASADLPEGFSFVGHDYGYFWWAWGHYSVIYSEIIYGLHPLMREFAMSLNEHLLLPTVDQAQPIAATRQALLAQGVDLESNADEWYAVGIWLYSEPGGSRPDE